MEYIASESMYCLERDGKYINFTPVPLQTYFAADHVCGEYWDGEKYEKITFRPEPADLAYHRSYKFEDLTFRGTLEFRSCCEQPAGECMSVAAWFAGLMEELTRLETLLEQDRSLYGHGYTAIQLRQQTAVSAIPPFADKSAVREFLLHALELAESGLRRRGYGEEHFLTPLYERAETLTNPAVRMKQALEAGTPVDEIVRQYAAL